MTIRPEIPLALRIVIKLGTRVLTHDDGRLALARLFRVVEAAAALRRQGKEVLLVSSGAVGLGVEALGLESTPSDIVERQACAAVGQTRLMDLYQQGFSRLGLVCGQVLLTQSDFADRDHYINLRSTLNALLRHGVVPIINENDAVSTEELDMLEGGTRPIFGDNDKLSALVAVKLDADLLVLLTDVDGVFDKNPRKYSNAKLLSRIDDNQDADIQTSGTGSTVSRGGMLSKIEAAWIAARSGCHAIIASGRSPTALSEVLAGHQIGTLFPAAQHGLTSRRRWIAFATAPRGELHLDAGAVHALRDRGASLLAIGVNRVEGSFEGGEVVELVGPDGKSIGRGMTHCNSDLARAWVEEGAAPAGTRNHHALVHRSNLVLN